MKPKPEDFFQQHLVSQILDSSTSDMDFDWVTGSWKIMLTVTSGTFDHGSFDHGSDHRAVFFLVGSAAPTGGTMNLCRWIGS